MNDQSLSDQLKEFFENLVTNAINLLPRLILGLLVILIGIILARVSQKLVFKLILYIDNQVNTRLRKQFLSVNLQSSARFAAKTTFWIIILLTVAVLTQVLGLSVLTTWFNALLTYLPNIVTAVVIIFVGIILGRLTGDLLSSSLLKEGTKRTHLRNLVQFTILFVASVIAANQVGIEIQFLTNLITIIIASLLFGAALAFGLGASTSVSNILGSYYLQKSYQEGNTIRIGEVEGTIVKITPTAVFIKTKSGDVTVPAKVFNEEKTVLLKEN